DRVTLKKIPAYRGARDYRNLPVSAIMNHDLITVSASETPEEALERLPKASGGLRRSYPVVDGEIDSRRGFLGIVMRHELEESRRQKPAATVREIIDGQKVESITPDTSIRDAAMHMVRADIRQLPVLSATEPDRLLGMLTLNDVARQQNAASDQLGRS
ncbi:MAG: CBS domain-containing protein, partial [Verrucomicrobiota bacterium]